MSRIDIDGPVVIKRRIETHTRTDANALDLAILCHFCRYGVPAKQSGGGIRQRIEPALIDGVRKGIYVNGCCGSFQIGIGSVEQLVPEARTRLLGRQPFRMRFQQVENSWSAG